MNPQPQQLLYKDFIQCEMFCEPVSSSDIRSLCFLLHKPIFLLLAPLPLSPIKFMASLLTTMQNKRGETFYKLIRNQHSLSLYFTHRHTQKEMQFTCVSKHRLMIIHFFFFLFFLNLLPDQFISSLHNHRQNVRTRFFPLHHISSISHLVSSLDHLLDHFQHCPIWTNHETSNRQLHLASSC